MKDIVIVGNGGFAREVEFLINRINEIEKTWNFLGYVDNEKEAENVWGNDDGLISYGDELHVVIAIGTSITRCKLYEKYCRNKNLLFPNLFDPSVIYSSKMQMGQGNIICAGTIMTVDLRIGSFNIINLDCTIGHDTVIEDYVTINPSVNLSGNTCVSSLCNLGTGSQVIQGKCIGRNVTLGAGAVVVTDIEDNAVAVGVPAKIVKMNV